MNSIRVVETTPDELINLINQSVKSILKESVSIQKSEQTKPHFTRKETADFFNVSVNCINNWCNSGILTPYKVGQRTYFKRSECESVVFNQKEVR